MTDDEALNAFLDGEIGPAERAALEARLAAEPALRERLEALRGSDRSLREAFAFAPAASEEAAARFRLPAPRASRPWPWLLLPAAAAAGLAAGLLLPRETVPAAPLPPPPPPRAAFVSLATGPIRTSDGTPLAAGQAVPEGAIVESAGGRASLVLADGTEVRLDRGARLGLGERRRVRLEGGRVWARVAPGEPFLVAAGEARVTVTGTELSVRREEEATGVQLFSGSARVEAGGAARDLAAGQEAVYAGGTLSEARRIDSEAIATGWMLELYAHSGSHDRDLAEHLDRLLAEIGRRKMALVEERTVVKELGPSCRVPVARFLVSEGAQEEPEARRKAARVLETIADASVAPDLAAALRDPDGEVRVSAARAIRRLTDGRVCADPKAFLEACDLPAAEAADRWAREQEGPPR